MLVPFHCQAVIHMRIHLLLSATCCATALLLSSCKGGASADLPAFDEAGVNLRIEHPAGTLMAPHAALTSPGNTGVIPATQGEDGRPLPCLLIGKARAAGDAIKILPVAAVQWRHEGSLSTQIIAVPTKPEERSCPAEDYMTLRMQYDHVRQALELWFRHHYMPPDAEWLGWQNEVYAEEEIFRSARRFAE